MSSVIAPFRKTRISPVTGGEIGLLLGGLGTVQAFYLAIIAYLQRARNNCNILLCLLVLMLCIRVIKSLLWLYWSLTPDWVLNIGFFAHSTAGPLLFLYTYHYIYKIKWTNRHILHFIPSLFLLGLTFSANLENFWYAGAYTILLFHQISYSLLATAMVCNRKSWHGTTGPGKEGSWIIILVLNVLLLQAAYFSNYILGITPYILGPVFFSALIYWLSFFALLYPDVFPARNFPKKYSNINLSPEEVADYRNCILQYMKASHPYLLPGFTLNDLAKHINLPAYLVSHIINSEFNQNFPDFINSFRIKHAKKLLQCEDYKVLKITSVAYDSGFNSLSVFNASFKKYTGMTPSDFRKHL